MRRHLRAVRLLLVALALSLSLNAIAYVAHQHKVGPGTAPGTHVELCGYCSAFGGLAAAPAPTAILRLLSQVVWLLPLIAVVVFPVRTALVAQARAPPAR